MPHEDPEDPVELPGMVALGADDAEPAAYRFKEQPAILGGRGSGQDSEVAIGGAVTSAQGARGGGGVEVWRARGRGRGARGQSPSSREDTTRVRAIGATASWVLSSA